MVVLHLFVCCKILITIDDHDDIIMMMTIISIEVVCSLGITWNQKS